MNKKFLSVVLFGALMAGSSVTFTGCIDNDEPAGIEELRGAKAELIRAKVAVEAANAARENANAALILAQAEVQKAQAAYWNAEAAKKQAEADSMAAVSDEARAKAEYMIAYYKQQMEEAALTHDSVMAKLQKDLAVAKRQYELAIKQIEIAKATLSEKDLVKVSSLQELVDNLYAQIYGGTIVSADGTSTTTVTVENSLVGIVDAKQKTLNEILMKKAHGLYVDDDQKDNLIEEYQNQIVKDSLDVVTATKKVADLEAFVEKNPAAVNWVEEIETLTDSIKALENQSMKLASEIEIKENSQEAVDAELAYKKAQRATNEYETKIGSKGEKLPVDAYKYEYAFDNGYSYGLADFEIKKNDPAGTSLEAVKSEIVKVDHKLAGYTSERINVLKNWKENGIKTETDTYQKAVKLYKDAKTKYEGCPAEDKWTNANKTGILDIAEAAVATYTDAVSKIENGTGTDTDKAIAKLTAANTLASALVTFYTEAEKFNVVLANFSVLNTTTVGGTEIPTGYTTKTIKEWLSGTNGGVELMNIATEVGDVNYFVEMVSTGEQETITSVVDGKTKIEHTISAGLVKRDNKTSLLTALVTASEDAFGLKIAEESQSGKKYLEIEPTEAEVIAFVQSGHATFKECGAMGEYLDAKLAMEDEEYENYEAWMKDLVAAKVSLTAEKESIEAAQKVAVEKLEALNTAEKEAEEAWETAKDTKELTAQKQVVDAYKDAAGEVKKALVGAVNTYLNNETDGQINDYEGFIESLNGKIAEAKTELNDKKIALANAKVTLEKALSGEYGAEVLARKQLEAAMTDLEKAQDKYAVALKNLETALQIMAGDTSAE